MDTLNLFMLSAKSQCEKMNSQNLFMFSAKSQCKKMNTMDLFMFSGDSSPPTQVLGIQTKNTKNLTRASLEARVRFNHDGSNQERIQFGILVH